MRRFLHLFQVCAFRCWTLFDGYTTSTTSPGVSYEDERTKQLVLAFYIIQCNKANTKLIWKASLLISGMHRPQVVDESNSTRKTSTSQLLRQYGLFI